MRLISYASIFAPSYECVSKLRAFVIVRASEDALQDRRFHRGIGESSNSITEIQMAAKKGGRKAAKKGGAKKGAKRGGAKKGGAKKGGAKRKSAAKKRR